MAMSTTPTALTPSVLQGFPKLLANKGVILKLHALAATMAVLMKLRRLFVIATPLTIPRRNPAILMEEVEEVAPPRPHLPLPLPPALFGVVSTLTRSIGY